MISFDFEYYRPNSIMEAYETYNNLVSSNKAPLYYSGGTEIISMARVNSIQFDAVIDLKGIPDCNQLNTENRKLVIGSALSLTQIATSGAFPLLKDTITRIADHTIQGKITLGGNLAGTIKYREAALPLMISDCTAKVMTQNGIMELPFLQIFDGRLQLKNGEYLVAICIKQDELNLPHNHTKKTKMDKIDYPLITMAAVKSGPSIKAAITGYGDKPLLLPTKILSDVSLSVDKRIKKVIAQVRSQCVSDLSGSKEYREFVLNNILAQMFSNFSDNG